MDFLQDLFRHLNLKHIGALIATSVAVTVPLVGALVLPVILASNLPLGFALLLGGLTVAGQALAFSGRLLDRRWFPGKEKRPLGWAEAAGEGALLGLVLIGLFSLLFSSLPYYLAQGTAFSWFSVATLAVGTLLILGALPFYLPVRRREGLGVFRSVVRAFQVMNRRPGLALLGLVLGFLTLGASVMTAGLFPGFGGLAALHQGLYDRAVREAS